MQHASAGDKVTAEDLAMMEALEVGGRSWSTSWQAELRLLARPPGF
jgi:hypothetical protein